MTLENCAVTALVHVGPALCVKRRSRLELIRRPHDGRPTARAAPRKSGDEPPPVETDVPTLLGDVAFSAPNQSFRGELQVALNATFEGSEISTILRAGAFVRSPTVTTCQGQLDALREHLRAGAAWIDAQLERTDRLAA